MLLCWQGRAQAILHILVQNLGPDNALKRDPAWLLDCLTHHTPMGHQSSFPVGLNQPCTGSTALPTDLGVFLELIEHSMAEVVLRT